MHAVLDGNNSISASAVNKHLLYRPARVSVGPQSVAPFKATAKHFQDSRATGETEVPRPRGPSHSKDHYPSMDYRRARFQISRSASSATP